MFYDGGPLTLSHELGLPNALHNRINGYTLATRHYPLHKSTPRGDGSFRLSLGGAIQLAPERRKNSKTLGIRAAKRSYPAHGRRLWRYLRLLLGAFALLRLASSSISFFSSPLSLLGISTCTRTS